jgi:hypothetical protein
MPMIINEEWNKGYNAGLKAGAQKAKKTVAIEFVNRLQSLRNEKGIGPVTWDKIMDHLDINKEDTNA